MMLTVATYNAENSGGACYEDKPMFYCTYTLAIIVIMVIFLVDNNWGTFLTDQYLSDYSISKSIDIAD